MHYFNFPVRQYMLRTLSIVLLGLISAGLTACSAGEPATPQNVPLSRISLPPGFRIELFCDSIVDGARSMTRSPEGTIYVGTRATGNVYALPDRNGDNKADEVLVIAEGLFMPNGVAFRDGALYVAEVNRILRFDNIEHNLKNPPQAVVVKDDFPDETHHGWKFIRFGPDGKLYVPVGAPCNVCLEDDARFASIMAVDITSGTADVYAHGVRNSVGFDWHPQTNELWFTDNGRDWMGDDSPPDELNRAPHAGMHFGFPYCHGGDVADPDYCREGDCCARYTPPARKLGAHVAALGMRFYTGNRFPASFRHAIFIAEHGSWNRSVPDGYRIGVATLDGNTVTDYRPFAEGWLHEGSPWGRPVDILQLPDGSLLVSDDFAGLIYRISYQ